MAESAAERKIDAQRRRSERITQRVPVTITGVDALGRAFTEQTSALIVSCHGCRYESKHYVLKNTWVTLEVSHPDAPGESGSGSVRAKVTWMQRPHTLREMFHVAVELEEPGNIWGIASHPDDWSSFAENVADRIQNGTGLAMQAAALKPEPQHFDNLRVLPVAGTRDTSQMLSEKMAVLVEDGKQQLRETLAEMLTEAVGTQAAALSANWQQQLERAAHVAVQEAATVAAKRAVQEMLGSMQSESSKFDERSRNALNELQRRASLILEAQSEELASRAERAISKATRNIQTSIERTGQEHLTRLKKEMEESLQKIHSERDAVAGASEDALETARGRLQETLNRISRGFEAGLEEKTRLAADSLSNAANKYEADLERQSQAVLARLCEKTEGALRGKAGEFLVLFAEELEHYNRSYLEHAHAQWNDKFGEVASRARTEFEKALSLTREREFVQTRGQFAAAGQIVLGQLEESRRARQEEMSQALAASSDQAAIEFRRRLENTSNAWMLTTVSRLDQQSGQILQSIMSETEGRLAEACSRIFAEFSQNLRQRLLNSSQSEKARSTASGK